MEGFIKFKIRPWIRRLVTRTVAILPGAIILLIFGDKSATQLLVWSQVVLSIQLPFTIVPLIRITSHRSLKEHQNYLIVTILGWICCLLVIALNVWLLIDQILQNFEMLNIALWVLIGIFAVGWLVFTIIVVFVPISPKELEEIIPTEEVEGVNPENNINNDPNDDLDPQSQPQLLVEEEGNDEHNKVE